MQWDIFHASQVGSFSGWDDYCVWGSGGTLFIALGRVLLHEMVDRVRALRITQGIWLAFTLSLPLTGLTWDDPTRPADEPWTIDAWVHNMGTWSTICVIGYLLFGAVHGSLCLPAPLLLLGSIATILSSGGTSIVRDIMAGEEVRDGLGICTWLVSYVIGLSLSTWIVVPAARHFLTAEARVESLLTSKERLEYDLALMAKKQGSPHSPVVASAVSPRPSLPLSALQDGQRSRGAASVASSEGIATSVHTAWTSATAVEEGKSTTVSAGQAAAPAQAQPAHLIAGRPPSVAGSVARSHCTASSMLTVEADVQVLEQQYVIGNSEYDQVQTSDDE